MNGTALKTQNIRLAAIVFVVAVLLLIPAAAMRFTDEVKWSPFDFVVAGVLLLGAGLACELVMRRVRELRYRLIICGAVLMLLFVIWAELAVGLIGTPLAGN
ncbi:MAG: hypothetical protein ACK4S4_14765 [Pyrinomonadaceae bacterium]